MRLNLKRRLRCSFCRQTDAEVDKLLAGAAGVHICDACVGVCNRILDVVPASVGGWDRLSDTELLAALKPAEATIDAVRSVLQAQIETLRKRGVTWGEIGQALGITRQAAWERFS